MRKAIVPSVEVAENILTGTRTSERRRLPDQTGIGAMLDTFGKRYGTFPNLGEAFFAASEQRWTANKNQPRFPLIRSTPTRATSSRGALNPSASIGEIPLASPFRSSGPSAARRLPGAPSGGRCLFQVSALGLRPPQLLKGLQVLHRQFYHP